MSAPDLLRLALTYSLAIYEDAADGSSEYHLASVFNGVDDALLSDEVRVWKSKTPHPWTMSSAIVATIETTKEKDVVPDLKCVLYYHAARKGLYVTFRGTHNMENAITDLKYFQEILDVSVFLPPSDVGWKESTPVVHSGFHAAYLCLRPRLLMAIKEALSSLTHCTDVICVGHSLGGALANFAALDISINKAQFRPNWNSGLVTFGAPMVGNQAFVDYCNDAVVNSLRIANRLDPVAHCLEAGKVTASWLSHNHEPYVHAGRTALVLELDLVAETLSVVKNTMLDATQRSSSLLASGLSSLKAKVVDQHTGLGYILALERHIEAQRVAGKHVMDQAEDPNAKVIAALGVMGSILKASVQSAWVNFTTENVSTGPSDSPSSPTSTPPAATNEVSAKPTASQQTAPASSFLSSAAASSISSRARWLSTIATVVKSAAASSQSSDAPSPPPSAASSSKRC